MSSLLKADFRRIRKDKLLLIMGILAVAFAVVIPLIYAAIFRGLASLDEMTASMLSGLITGKSQFFASFSMSGNLGLIAPVLLAIALCKDFSFGTIRNKIIAGKSRSAIFFSLFITCATALVGVMLLHAFLTLGVSLIFFDYQSEPFTVSDLWYFLASLGFELLALVYAAAMLSWLCASMKNVGLVVVFYVAIVMIFSLGGSISQAVTMILESSEGNKVLLSVLHFLDRINVCNAAAYIGAGTHYTTEDVLYLTVPAVVEIIGFLGLGLYKFKKKDLK